MSSSVTQTVGLSAPSASLPAGDTRLSVAFDVPEANNARCRILPLHQGNPQCQHRLEDEGIQSNSGEGLGAAGG